jgi:phosphatidylinositol alpha-1,6-mannosyltransferase
MNGRRPRRVLSIGHSYCVSLNRRLVNEMAKAGGEDWEICAVAPQRFHGDLGWIETRELTDELFPLKKIATFLSRRAHIFFYGPELRAVMRESWDAIHCWEEPYVFAGGQVALFTPTGVPLVFWTGQNVAKRYPPPFSRIERYCIERCAGWMARGRTGEATLLTRGYDRRPHEVVPLGVDVEAFHPDTRARNSIHAKLGWLVAGPPVIGFLGRFVEEKGLSLLTRVLDDLKSGWRGLFVGGGPLEKQLRRWAARYGDRVRVVSGVSHERVPHYLNAMDMLCAPSQTAANWKEIFGRMLIEAFACGLPVIASDSGEIPYIVGDAAVVVGERDRPGWVREIGRLMENPAARRELSEQGLERSRRRYGWPVVARQHVAFLERVMQS